MGLTSSLYTGLTGLNANSSLISVTGNNIANVNTTGYKSTRLNFETQISQLLSPGSSPQAVMGGTNPLQIGLGVRMGSQSRNFATGDIQPTGVNSDVAIDGNGFFVLKNGQATQYTRAGDFSLDENFNLTQNGGQLQGYGVDSNFSIIPGVLTDLTIPVGVMTLAEATENVQLGGNLNAGGTTATVGSIHASDAMTDSSTSAAATDTSLMTDLLNGSTSMFAAGDTVRVSGVSKGGAVLGTHSFTVTATSTLGDFTDFLAGVMGIDTTITPTPSPTPGISIDSTGAIVITGNTGTVNDIDMDGTNIIVNPGTGATQPLDFSKTQDATGESVRTVFQSYDSLGNSLNIDLSIVLEEKTATGTVWRFYTQSEDDSDVSRVLNNGTLTFNSNGQLTDITEETFIINRDGTGAESPQSITLTFDGPSGTLSALADTTSEIAALSQDGAPIGTLKEYAISDDGTIVGTFSNSLNRTLGQLVLATFTNPQGLISTGDNFYREGVNSGTAQIYTPNHGGSGKLVGGALEQSNVDLSQEFINLISASTGFSASSRVLTTSDQLLQELMTTVR